MDDNSVGLRSNGQNPLARGASRRQVLRAGALGLAVGAQVLGASRVSARASTASLIDYTSAQSFDSFYSAFVKAGTLGQAGDYNDVLGALAWGQTYVQQGLLRMYEAYHKRPYLATVMQNIDGVLATRDSERGVTDYRGLSLPAWRSGNPYTAGAVSVPDASGRPALQVRSVRTPIETLDSYTGRTLSLTPVIHVETSAGTQPGTFKLTVRHDTLNVTDVLDNLTMDTVEDRVKQAWPTQNLLTVKDLRSETGAGEPAPGSSTMSSQMCVFAVHTGMITYPIAWAGRLILDDPQLNREPDLRQKAEEYIGACEAALAVHDSEWRENDAGEGWYDFTRGMPVDFDGTELPANQFLAVARTMIHLAAVTGDQRYRDRAEKMARTYRNQLTLGVNDAYTWHYWPTWGHVYRGYTVADNISDFRLSYSGATQVEDISHGHIDVDFAVAAYRNQIVFDQTDMRRFANTFTRNVATTSDGKPTAWSAVDGTGTRGSLAFDELSALWMPVAFWDRNVFTHINSTYTADAISPQNRFSGFLILGVGNLPWFAKVGGR